MYSYTTFFDHALSGLGKRKEHNKTFLNSEQPPQIFTHISSSLSQNKNGLNITFTIFEK